MKTLTKAVAAASLATVSVAAFAETSLTVGGVSDYYFRGGNLGDAGAYASVDYENSGFYAGVWAIDDGSGGNDGLETDFYLGYAGEVEGFSYSIGYTRYEYTYDTGDNTAAEAALGVTDVQTRSQFEQEINLGLGVAGFALDLAFGTAEADHTVDGTTDADTEQDYTYIALSYENGPWAAVLGMRDADDIDAGAGIGTIDMTDSEYKHIEVSYSADVGGFGLTATLGQQFGIEDGGVDTPSKGNNYMILDLSKSFDL